MKISVNTANYFEFIKVVKEYCEYVVKKQNKSCINSKNVLLGGFDKELYTLSYNNQLKRIEVLENRSNTFECLYIRDNIVFTTFEKYALKSFCDKITHNMINCYPSLYVLKTELEFVYQKNMSQISFYNDLSSMKHFIYGMLANGKTVYDICYSIAGNKGIGSVRNYEMLYPEALLGQIFSEKIYITIFY